MKVLLLGGSGVLGSELIPALRSSGHDVLATGRSAEALATLHDLDATTVTADVFNTFQLKSLIAQSGADAIINQLTSLPASFTNPIEARRAMKRTDRLRGEIGPLVVEAAVEAGISTIVSQSVAFACAPSHDVLDGDEPLWVQASGAFGKANRALAALEAATSAANGTVLRYGAFYGPGTYYAPDGGFTKMIAQRRLPIIGEGRGMYGFIHVGDAAAATVAALEAASGTYSIVDDTPVRSSEWSEAAAINLGVRKPRRLPSWAAVGPLAALRYLSDRQPAVSNETAKDALGWTPARPSWKPALLDSMTVR